MTDPVRVSLQSETDETSVRVHDDEGTVDNGDATFQFSVPSRADEDGSDASDDRINPKSIAPLSAVPADGTLRCEAMCDDRGTEFILHQTGDAVVSWKNSCLHRPNVSLDPGTGAIVSGDQLVCHKHGARFEQDEGVCTAGPCAGDALDSIAVEVRDETVFLTDDRFESARPL
jgi:nitrite reductase/ring-hydroxylating ferredoxin subunit